MEPRTTSLLVGSLLGDGWLSALTPSTKKAVYYLKYNDKSIEYLRWMRQQLVELQPSELKSIPKYSQHYFYTRASTDVGKMRSIFYPNEGRKRVPGNIEKLLSDPLALAIWYQDDGTLDRRSKYHWNAIFATYCFPYEECILLATAVRRNFGIEMSVCRCKMRGKMYYRLYVLSDSMKQFMSTIGPYIHEDYQYKISSK